MREINSSTQKAQGFMNAYNYARRTGHTDNLYSVYNNFSQAKYNALEYCKRIQREYNGYNACVVNGNSFHFTYAFEYVEENTGCVKLMYITHTEEYTMDFIS